MASGPGAALAGMTHSSSATGVSTNPPSHVAAPPTTGTGQPPHGSAPPTTGVAQHFAMAPGVEPEATGDASNRKRKHDHVASAGAARQVSRPMGVAGHTHTPTTSQVTLAAPSSAAALATPAQATSVAVTNAGAPVTNAMAHGASAGAQPSATTATVASSSPAVAPTSAGGATASAGLPVHMTAPSHGAVVPQPVAYAGPYHGQNGPTAPYAAPGALPQHARHTVQLRHPLSLSTPEEYRVNITKPAGAGFGLDLREQVFGGIDMVEVAALEHGAAAKQGAAIVDGDVVVHVNGQGTAGLKFGQVVELFKGSGDSVVLGLRPTAVVQSDAAMWARHMVPVQHQPQSHHPQQQQHPHQQQHHLPPPAQQQQQQQQQQHHPQHGHAPYPGQYPLQHQYGGAAQSPAVVPSAGGASGAMAPQQAGPSGYMATPPMGLQHSYQQQQPNHYLSPAVAHGHPGQHQGAAVPTHAGVHGSQPHAMPQAPPPPPPQMYAPGVHAGLQDAFGGQGAPGGAQYYPGSAPQPHQAPGLAPQPPRHAAGSPLHNEGYMAVLSSLVLRDVNDTVEPDVFDAAGGFSRYVTAHVTVGATWPADGPHRRAAVKADLTLHASCKLGHNTDTMACLAFEDPRLAHGAEGHMAAARPSASVGGGSAGDGEAAGSTEVYNTNGLMPFMADAASRLAALVGPLTTPSGKVLRLSGPALARAITAAAIDVLFNKAQPRRVEQIAKQRCSVPQFSHGVTLYPTVAMIRLDEMLATTSFRSKGGASHAAHASAGALRPVTPAGSDGATGGGDAASAASSHASGGRQSSVAGSSVGTGDGGHVGGRGKGSGDKSGTSTVDVDDDGAGHGGSDDDDNDDDDDDDDDDDNDLFTRGGGFLAAAAAAKAAASDDDGSHGGDGDDTDDAMDAMMANLEAEALATAQ